MNNLDNLRKKIIESKTFCFYPYLELSTNPAGHTRPCCYYDGFLYPDDKNWKEENDSDVLTIHTPGNTLEKIWETKNLQELRRLMWNGDLPKGCLLCKRDGNASMRARSVTEYKNDIEVLQLVDDTINNDFKVAHLPIRLELKPSNLCNLKCTMCNSYDSSQIGKELTDLSKKFKGINVVSGRFNSINTDTEGITEHSKVFQAVPTTDYSENVEIWNSFIAIVPTLRVLSFAGGEPTLLPFVNRALTYCVENGYATNITVFIASNFTNLNKNFLDLMPHFKKFELIASIDGIEKIQEYARFPSKWSQISNNYLLAKQYMKHPNVKIVINITVSILNVTNLDKLLYWIEERANEFPYFSQWPFNINLLYGPHDQQINHLPDITKQLCRDRLHKYLHDSVILKEFLGLDSKIHLILRELDKPANKFLLDEFKMKTKIFDEHRNINIEEYIPDLKEIFNER